MKLTRLLAAQAEPEEAPAGQEANGADDAMRLNSFGVQIVQLDDKAIGIVHGALQYAVHGVCLEWSGRVRGERQLGDRFKYR